MALTIAQIRKSVFGNMRIVIATVTFDATYPAGGEPLIAADLQLKTIEFLAGSANGGYVPEYDHANEKLILYHADYDAVADGPLVENTTADVSAVVTRILAIGK